MNTSNQISIRSDYERIFSLASRVEEWGTILPHYRYVKVLKRRGNRTWVKMSAWRDFVPVTWSAVATVERGSRESPGRVLFHHIRGLVRGMDVVWSFEPRPEQQDVLVTISHYLERPPFPTRVLGRRLIETVVGRGFIGHIAGKTLLQVKRLAEAETEQMDMPNRNLPDRNLIEQS